MVIRNIKKQTSSDPGLRTPVAEMRPVKSKAPFHQCPPVLQPHICPGHLKIGSSNNSPSENTSLPAVVKFIATLSLPCYLRVARNSGCSDSN